MSTKFIVKILKQHFIILEIGLYEQNNNILLSKIAIDKIEAAVKFIATTN